MPSPDASGHRDFAMKGPLAERAAAALDHPVEPAPTRPAATVLLLRDAPAGPARAGKRSPLEVFMQRRTASMAFAPSMWVFPGGSVSAEDDDADLPWAGPSAADWATRLDLPVEQARGIVVAAVRELFEECGVLLASTPQASAVVSTDDGVWQVERSALVEHRQSMGAVLRRHGLVMRTDLLSWRDHWITPAFEPRRYDTYFFAARLPSGQDADDATTEADEAEWVDPAMLLEQVADGRARALPPTIVNVERLAASESVDAYLARPEARAPVMPRLVRTDGSVVLRADLPDSVGD